MKTVYLAMLLYGSFILLSLQFASFDNTNQMVNNVTRVNISAVNNNTTVACKNPTFSILQDTHGAKYLIYVLFQKHGFIPINCNRYIRIHEPLEFCLRYNGKTYSKYHCNGGRYNYFNQFWKDPEYPNIELSATKYGLNMVTKQMLSRILRLYCAQFDSNDTSICKFRLLSYEIDDKIQRIEFITNHVNCSDKESKYENIWVFKENNHMGNGIHFINNHRLIYSLISPDKYEQDKYYDKACQDIILHGQRPYFQTEGFLDNTFEEFKVRNGLIIQEFVANPLLIENKLFHLREFFLIASYSPLIVLSYAEGVLFRNPNEFNKNYKKLNKNAMRSNIHIALNNVNESECDFELFWGFKRFQRYLNEVYGEELFNYTTDKLPKDINYIIKHIFNANMYYNKLNNWTFNEQEMFNGNIDMTWYTMCMDISITNEFELKVFEIQQSCGMPCQPNLDSSWKNYDNDGYEWMCNQFAIDTINVLTEIYKKIHDNIEINTIDSLGGFQIAFIETMT